MKVLLTGANGHLGANIVRQLLKHGHEIISFVRPTSDLRGLRGLDVTLVKGDVTDAAALARAAEGCDAIIHTATHYAYWAKNAFVIEETAMKGAQNVVDAAKRADVQRLVYTSSSWAIGLTDDPNAVLTADDWNDCPHSLYARAKTFSERTAWELADRAGVPMISLCPGALFGPYDYRPTPSTRMLLGMADGSGRTFNGGLAMADIRDAATIHALAVDHGEVGQRYAITQCLHLREMGEHVTALTGKKVKHFGAPKAIARLVGGMMEFGAHFTGKEPPLTRGIIDDAAGRYMYIDGSRTWQTFNHTPFPVRETVRESLTWYVKMGWLKENALVKNALNTNVPPTLA